MDALDSWDVPQEPAAESVEEISARLAAKTNATVEWLKSMLADGERASKEIIDLGKAEGRSEDAIRVAAKKLNLIKSKRLRGVSYWRLPNVLMRSQRRLQLCPRIKRSRRDVKSTTCSWYS